MLRKRWFLLMGVTLFVASIVNLSPSPAYAQCDTGSNGSCANCHLDQYPVYGQGIWHDVHARKDCCTNCHGGNCSTMDKDSAHVGINSNPLADVYTNCHACHPDDYWQRAAVFAAELRITPASRATPTLIPTSDPAGRQPEIELIDPVDTTHRNLLAQGLAFASIGLVTVITFFGASYLTHRLST